MIKIQTQNFDQEEDPDMTGDDNFDDDDLITFQHELKKINFYYSQLTKYSKRIRDTYLFLDVYNRFPQEIQKFQEEFQLLPESVDYFFQLLRQNCDIDGQLNLTYIHCIDLLKISKFFKIRKLSFKTYQYINDHKSDVDFVVQMIEHELKTQNKTEEHSLDISKEIEQLLTSKINECLSNEKFKELPIEILYRIISKSSQESINSNKLFDIIIRSINKYCVLFPFLELQKLSEDRLEELCEKYSNSDENTRQCFNHLKCNLNLIREMGTRKRNLEETNDEHQKRIDELETKFTSLQNQFNNTEQINNQLQNQLKDSKELNNEQQNKVKELENQVSQLQNKLTNSEKEINDVRKLLDKIFLIKGQISAKVENGLFINAEINLKEKCSSLDTSKSKFIISTSGDKSLGSDAYEKGEQITSLHMKTASYLCRPGTYFVRCIVFNSNGESNEIVSNSVTTSGSSATFNFKGEPEQISLYQGKYKLEVWGAKGGDSTGETCYKGSNYTRYLQSSVQGGLGGYSQGILNLNKNETVYVYVGGKGCPSDSSDGSVTKGGFPDGGGTKTGHYSGITTVPGTGGGSTSIRIGSNTNYSRVIVAGGGGGASGCCQFADPGGFGGGQVGGNCTYNSELQSQGAGTQTGSTCGFGCGKTESRNGDPGQFGLGATGKYSQGYDSGGGGGGGWYGGGSGGHGNSNWVSSGGGGSGWTFTEGSFREWQSKDATNASKFALNSAYYLTDEKTIGGNQEFPRTDGKGTECGHEGDGFAKITPL